MEAFTLLALISATAKASLLISNPVRLHKGRANFKAIGIQPEPVPISIMDNGLFMILA